MNSSYTIYEKLTSIVNVFTKSKNELNLLIIYL